MTAATSSVWVFSLFIISFWAFYAAKDANQIKENSKRTTEEMSGLTGSTATPKTVNVAGYSAVTPNVYPVVWCPFFCFGIFEVLPSTSRFVGILLRDYVKT